MNAHTFPLPSPVTGEVVPKVPVSFVSISFEMCFDIEDMDPLKKASCDYAAQGLHSWGG